MSLLSSFSQRAFPAGIAGTAPRFNCILDHDVPGGHGRFGLRMNLLGVCGVGLCSNSGARGERRAGPRLPGVVGAAPGALLPQHVEPHARRRAAVVAQDPHHLRQVDLRHRRRRDLLVELPPRVRHVASGPRAHRAREVMVRSHLVHALQMNRVAALQHADVLRGVEQILKADRAVVMHCSFHTAVRVLQDIAVATPACVAVKEVVCTASSAYATSMTVVLALRDIIVEKIAYFTEVFPHAGPTVRTILLHILFFGTESADHLYSKTVSVRPQYKGNRIRVILVVKGIATEIVVKACCVHVV